MSLENPALGRAAHPWRASEARLPGSRSRNRVSQVLVKRYGRPPGQSWWTFLRNHMPQIAAMDLFFVPTLAFSVLYGFIIVPPPRARLDRRDEQPNAAEWIAGQITEAFP
jgi:hypothetical protein